MSICTIPGWQDELEVEVVALLNKALAAAAAGFFAKDRSLAVSGDSD